MGNRQIIYLDNNATTPENPNAGTSEPDMNNIFGSNVNGYYNPNTIDDTKFQAWINASGQRSEVTKTYYDEQVILPVSPYTQNNLRKRVASVTYEDLFDNNDVTYNHATHYSYDIHGNVSTLWQENTQVSVSGEEIKQIDYQYDLISGKVNKVIYSPNQPDQFIHRYSYDADNRITKVETSSDGLHYDVDAKYFYYAHGPLARVEYGKDQVQGVDYAYTLQGWIKGVNSNTLRKDRDMGNDGDLSFANPNGNFAKDIFGYTLNYYQGDYEAIDYMRWNNANTRFESYKTGSDLLSSSSNLFNGNISSMVTSISRIDTNASGTVLESVPLPMGNSYRYDQLNRLTRSWSYDNIDTAANSWQNTNATASIYRNTFSYDANGNIQTQVRRDSVGGLMDSLTYNYERDVNGKLLRNRLYHVNDFVSGTPAYLQDITDQGTFNPNNINSNNNYGFDEIGNLVRDDAEEIQNIEWTVSGKIKSITRTIGSQKSNLSFDYDASGNRIAKHVYDSNNDWEHSTYYIRDAQGNVLSVYKKDHDPSLGIMLSYRLTEAHIYGSSRLGMLNSDIEMIGSGGAASTSAADTTKYYLGNKRYELSNHLGNVLATISDKKIAIDYDNDDVIDGYVADMANAQDYYAFGAPMAGRQFNIANYRYGFNGQEKTDEISGNGNHNTAQFWEYDTRTGRRWNLEPKKDPSLSDYAVFRNNPILFSDELGDIPWPKITGSTKITSHLKTSRTIGGSTKPHQGLDIGAAYGSTYHSAAGGRVIATSGDGNFKDNPLDGNYKVAPNANDGGGWGNYVVVDHGKGIITLYAHMKEGSMSVKVGDKIEDGQSIGEVGNSGNSYGAHAHVEAIFNEDGSEKFTGKQFKSSGDNKNAHVFSLEKINDLQDVVNGKEKPTVEMLDGSKKTIDTQNSAKKENEK
ncbi:MAG: peptidoglycan DD-metalloendopeptidase family protein [Bacteroidetes bacterium]|nr:peptidoglycan DD-metalloendopeptidase family protein [Bacteroidota bacterium]